MLSKLKNILCEVRLPLAPYREHGKVFERVPKVGFRRANGLKDILVGAKLASLEDCCRSCGGTRCEILKHIGTSETFKPFNTQREYWNNPNNLNCCSNNIVYICLCEAYSKQKKDSAESFLSILYNYESAHKNFINGKEYR